VINVLNIMFTFVMFTCINHVQIVWKNKYFIFCNVTLLLNKRNFIMSQIDPAPALYAVLWSAF